MKSNITHKRLKELVVWDNERRCLVWKEDLPYRHGKKGVVAGCKSSDDYWQIGLEGKRYRRGRIVWLYFKGSFPDGHIDHINGIKTDDRIENLRIATIGENNLNRRSAKSKRKYDLPKWVMKHGDKYRAKVQYGQHNFTVSCDTPEEAHRDAREFAQKHHGKFFNDGK